MLDIKQIRQQPDWFKEKLATRGVQPEEIDAVLELDAKRRELLQRTETLKAKRNEASKKIGEAKRAKQSADEAIAEMRQVGEDIKALDEQVEANDKDLFDKLAHLPNVPHEGVPVSLTEDGAEELRKVVNSTLNQSTTGKSAKTSGFWTLNGPVRFLAPASSTTSASGLN